MKLEKQDWQYSFLDEERLAIIEAAPSPLPDPIDLAAAIGELDMQKVSYGLISISHSPITTPITLSCDLGVRPI